MMLVKNLEKKSCEEQLGEAGILWPGEKED